MGEGEDMFADFAEGLAIGADGDGDGFRGADLGGTDEDQIQRARLLELDGDVLGELLGVAGGVAVRREGGPGAVGEAGVPAVGGFCRCWSRRSLWRSCRRDRDRRASGCGRRWRAGSRHS